MPLKTNILLLFLVPVFLLPAQNPHPYFRNYTTDDGLPSPEVHYCIEDDRGYMWFATDNGVSRFDGYEFKNYGPREGLKHNVVFFMQRDTEGRIWMATMNGQLYYVEQDSIHAFAKNKTIENTNKKNKHIIDFFIDSLDNKFISTQNVGILQFSREDAYLLLKPTTPTKPKLAIRIQDRWMMASQEVLESVRKLYWERKDGRYVFQPVEVRAETSFLIDRWYLPKSEKSSAFWLMTLSNDETIGFSGQTFLGLKENKIAWKLSFPYDIHRKSIYEDSDGSLLFGLNKGGGIRRYENIGQLRKGHYKQYLKDVTVSHIYTDHHGAYWIGTIEHGVFYCPDFDVKIYDRGAGFPNDYIAAFDFKNEKELFVGFINGQIISLNAVNDQIQPFPNPPRNIIYDILFDDIHQQLWVTTGRPYYWHNKAWNGVKRTELAYSQDYIISKKMTLSKDHKTLWGAHYNGFGAIDVLEKKAAVVSNELGLFNRAFRIWEDYHRRIWVGNVAGLFEFKDNQLIPPNPYHELFSTRVEDIAELSDSTLVIATKGEGLIFWKGYYFHQLTTDDGLTADMLENVHVDERDIIWAGTLEGLNKIIRSDSSYLIENYTISHGLPSNEITLVRSIGKQVWIGTTKGLIQWTDKPQTTHSPSPIMESVLVNDQPMDFSDVPTLSYQQNNLDFNFLSINYKLDGRIPYRFRLNDIRWKETNNRSTNYIQLPPGNYQFEVQSQNENKLWSASTKVRFQIKPPFWKTVWFTLLWMATAFGLAWLFYRNRINQIQQKAKIDQKINELQQSALRAQMNPHFIFNCLNAIQGFIAKKENEKAIHYLSKFASLIRGILNSSIAKQISLGEEIQLLENYLQLEQMRFKGNFSYDIVVDPTLHLFDTEIPPMLIQPFVENAILHGLHTNRKDNKITIHYQKNNNALHISVRDNGIGIQTSKALKKDVEQKHQSVGMTLVKKRLEILQQQNYGEHLKVSELKDEDGNTLGTEVMVKISLDEQR